MAGSGRGLGAHGHLHSDQFWPAVVPALDPLGRAVRCAAVDLLLHRSIAQIAWKDQISAFWAELMAFKAELPAGARFGKWDVFGKIWIAIVSARIYLRCANLISTAGLIFGEWL